VKLAKEKLKAAEANFEKITGAGGAKAEELVKAKEELPKLKEDVAKAKTGITDRQKEVAELIKKVCCVT